MSSQKWEYMQRTFNHRTATDLLTNSDMRETLRMLGDDGWELVTVVPAATEDIKVFYFKRPKQ
jgi:hypothetical protein